MIIVSCYFVDGSGLEGHNGESNEQAKMSISDMKMMVLEGGCLLEQEDRGSMATPGPGTAGRSSAQQRELLKVSFHVYIFI